MASQLRTPVRSRRVAPRRGALGITFDEFLQASQAEKLPFDERTGPGWLTEEECRDVLERMQLYIDAYDESQRKVGEVLAEELEDSPGF